MPHAYYTIDCSECANLYCVVCNDECPKCGDEPTLKSETMSEIERMRKHMSGPEEEHGKNI